MSTKLSDIQPGAVELFVVDLLKQKDFYSDVIGLDLLEENDSEVKLGKGDSPLVVLSTVKPTFNTNSSEAGLYHFALLYKSRGELARTLNRIFKKMPDLFSGSADHLVSEAFYLNDPEGNGIELYFDREKKLWKWDGSSIQMASLYISPQEYMQKYVTLEEDSAHVDMGHFHLKVGDISVAKKFYVDVLGFSVTAEYPGALFISVDGYHHHIGLNTWESMNAVKRTQLSGLKTIEFFVSSEMSYTQLQQRLTDHRVSFTIQTNSLVFHDPWNNQIRVVMRA